MPYSSLMLCTVHKHTEAMARRVQISFNDLQMQTEMTIKKCTQKSVSSPFSIINVWLFIIFSTRNKIKREFGAITESFLTCENANSAHMNLKPFGEWLKTSNGHHHFNGVQCANLMVCGYFYRRAKCHCTIQHFATH